MRISAAAALLVALAAVLVALVNAHSVFVFLWWLGLAAVGHRWAWGKSDLSAPVAVYSFYSLLAVAFYLAHLWTNPTYYGFSGGWGVGTDDSYFYSLVAYDMPFDFPTRFGVAAQHHRYADLLHLLVAVHRRIFPGLHPLDLLFFNTFGLSFLPFITRALYREVFPGREGERWAFLMTLIAPFILANGVILMRDGLVATTFTAGLLVGMRRKWLLFLVMLAATAWLRLQNGVMLLGVVFVVDAAFRRLDSDHLVWRRPDSRLKFLTVCALGAVAASIVASVVLKIQWWNLVFRGEFLARTIGTSVVAESGTSTFFLLSQLPVPLRIPLTLLFYLGSPFLALGALKAQGMWIPRAFLGNAFALLFPVYAAWFYRGVLRILRGRERGALVLLLLFLVNLSLVTQASMQLRHKIPLQPIFYVMAAYGATTPHARDRAFGWLVALLVVLADLGITVLQVVGS